MERSASVRDEPSDSTDPLSVSGWHWWLMAALLASSTTALQAESGTTTMASPALAVKAGRNRGLSVLERQRKEEEMQQVAEGAAAAKRKKASSTQKSAPAFVLADPSMPNGVGIMGRGRAAVNVPLTNDGDGVQA